MPSARRTPNGKLLLHGIQYVAALGVEQLNLRFVQGVGPVYVIRLQIHVDGHDHAMHKT